MARSVWSPPWMKFYATALDSRVPSPQGSASARQETMKNDLPDLSAIEEQALVLSQAAIGLDQARAGKRDPSDLAGALEANVEVWVAIRALVENPTSAIQQNIRDNLLRLSMFVASTTFMHGVDIPDSTLNTLININLQISEGLLEGAKRRN